MKFGVVNKSSTVNRFVLHTLQRNITHLAVITRKTNIKLGILKGGGGNWKRFKDFCHKITQSPTGSYHADKLHLVVLAMKVNFNIFT